MTDVRPYLREWAMPHVLCPGCAHGIVLRSLLEAIDRLALDQDSVAMVAGTAVHRILEDFDLTADPEEELLRQRGRLPELVASSTGEAERAAAVARAEEVLAVLAKGHLPGRERTNGT